MITLLLILIGLPVGATIFKEAIDDLNKAFNSEENK